RSEKWAVGSGQLTPEADRTPTAEPVTLMATVPFAASAIHCPLTTTHCHEGRRRTRQPWPEVRGDPPQRRVRGGRLPRGRPRVLAVPREVRGVRRRAEGGRRTRPAGQAADVHEPQRPGGPGGSQLLQAAGREPAGGLRRLQPAAGQAAGAG